MKQTNLSQSGRSMVEMLGTLAIIGVLSVGGIMGYSYGMDKWRANETVNDINLRRVILTQQVSQNNVLSLNEFSEQSTVGYSFLPPQEFDDSVALTINGVPKRICEMTVEALFDQTVQIDINRSVVDEITDCGEDNSITFYFPTDSLGDDERGQNGCALSTPVYNADTDTCEACPEITPIFDTASQTCVECITHSDCGSNTPICNASNMCDSCPAETPVWDKIAQACTGCETNDDCADDRLCFPTHKKCWTYTKYPIANTPGWVHIKINSSPVHTFDNAKFLCEQLGYQLPDPRDFVPDWDGKTLTNGQMEFPFTLSEIAQTIIGTIPSLGENDFVWTNEDRGVGVGAYWGYKIVFMRRRTVKGLGNAWNTNDINTICKP